MQAQTVAFDRLTDQQRTFLLEFEQTNNHVNSAELAGYKRARASAVLKSPRMKAAIAERRSALVVNAQADPPDVLRMLTTEAQRDTNTGAARVQALAKLADILGMTGGGGSREDGALSTFIRGIGAAVASGAFAGVSAAVGANAATAPRVPLPAPESPVVASARVVPAARVPGSLPLSDNPLPF